MARLNLSVIQQLQFIHQLSDRQTAHRLGWSASYWCEIKKGNKPVTMDIADSIVEVFRISYDRFLIHASLKDAPKPQHPLEGLVYHANGAPLETACRNPEHRMRGVMTRKEERTEQRRAVAGIPHQTRKKLWPRPKAWWQKNK